MYIVNWKQVFMIDRHSLRVLSYDMGESELWYDSYVFQVGNVCVVFIFLHLDKKFQKCQKLPY